MVSRWGRQKRPYRDIEMGYRNQRRFSKSSVVCGAVQAPPDCSLRQRSGACRAQMSGEVAGPTRASVLVTHLAVGIGDAEQ